MVFVAVGESGEGLVECIGVFEAECAAEASAAAQAAAHAMEAGHGYLWTKVWSCTPLASYEQWLADVRERGLVEEGAA